MYPIRFENLYYYKIWGGRDLKNFRDKLPDGMIGESWDIACHPNGMGIVENGEYKGRSLSNLINEYAEKLIGTKINTEVFPLLVKLINSNEKLSVQVHPNDEYARINENELGKTEAWYIVDAKEGAEIIVGTKDCDKDSFKKAIDYNKVEDYLNKIPVKKGDCFLITSGLVHAICEGLIIVEIQQNSDVTYRVYDYGRPREIHVEKALDVINFDLKCESLHGNIERYDGYTKEYLCENEYFRLEKYNIESKLEENSDEDRFFILTIVEGNGIIKSDSSILNIKKGDSILIPATLGKYSVEGAIDILKSFPMK